MPIVDTNAPLATNSHAAMWRQDHDAAKRYIEALLAAEMGAGEEEGEEG